MVLIPLHVQAEALRKHQGFYRSTYESVSLSSEEEMGFLGITYLVENQWGLYYGLGVYGAIKGQRGGFFTGGVEMGYQQKIFDHFVADMGLFAGGGGGGAAAQGGGMMLRPHVALLYDARYFKAGLSYSRVDFLNGDIKSDQWALQVEMPFEMLTIDPQSEQAFQTYLKSYQGDEQLGWSRHYFSATFQQYFPRSGTKDTANQSDLETISLLGFEYGAYMDAHCFGYLETAGAMGGGAGGYAEVLGGMGYEYAFIPTLGMKAKVALGSAGGGKVDTGGGFVYKAGIAAFYRPLSTLCLGVEAGYMKAPQGSFSANTMKMTLAYNMDFLGIKHDDESSNWTTQSEVGIWSIRVVNQTYLGSSTVRYNQDDQVVELVGLKIDREIIGGFYISGQAYGAYAGDVGGYASGLMGVGYRTPKFFNFLALYGEALGGAGAGGGVATQGGAIVQPMAGLDISVSQRLSLQVGGGMIKALDGTLNTAVVDLGIAYRFGMIERH